VYRLRDGNGGSVRLESQGTWRLASSNVNRLVLETTGGEELPVEFTLFQTTRTVQSDDDHQVRTSGGEPCQR